MHLEELEEVEFVPGENLMTSCVQFRNDYLSARKDVAGVAPYLHSLDDSIEDVVSAKREADRILDDLVPEFFSDKLRDRMNSIARGQRSINRLFKELKSIGHAYRKKRGST